MNPRTLRALLPVLREAREAGVTRIVIGDGADRFEVTLALPAPVAGEPIDAGTDPSAAADESEDDPRYFLFKHHRERNTRPSGGDS